MSKSADRIVYCLQEPDTGYPRYVGLSDRGPVRILKEHLKGKDRKKKYGCGAWLNSLFERGLVPEYSILEEYETTQEMSDGEVFWIAYLKMLGCDLLNLTNGGEHGRPSFETRRRISQSMKGRPSNVKGKILGPRPLEVKNKIAVSMIGKNRGPRSADIRKRISETMKRTRYAHVEVGG